MLKDFNEPLPFGKNLKGLLVRNMFLYLIVLLGLCAL